jgi:glycosyltransferase involved in cell wall biosynthesis
MGKTNENSSNQTSNSGSVDISIVICTRNRASKLAVTLKALKSLCVPDRYACEIVVIDNGSTDETLLVCATFARSPGISLRREYVTEPGLGRARNAGIRVSKGTIVAFTDDDVLPDANWLKVIAKEFLADPSLGAISGRVELQNVDDLPMTVRRQESRKDLRGLDDAFNTFIGCNFAVRRSVFSRIGLFDPEFGPGSRFHSADDSEFAYRAWKSGEKILYVPEMFVLHDHGRRSPQSEMDLIRAYLSGRGAFYTKYVLQGDPTAARHMYWEIRSSVRTLIERKQRLAWRRPLWLLKGSLGYVIFRLTNPLAQIAKSAH